MNIRSSRTATSAAALSLALLLAACGGDGDDAANASAGSSDLSGTLVGIGASSQTAAMQAWQVGMSDANPDVTVNYDPAGSGAGRKQFLAGGADFAGSDAYLDEEELAAAKDRCYGAGAVNLPMYISPIAVVYNVDGLDTLQLSPVTIAKIFNQEITSWDDPAIAADNPGAELPELRITPVNRSDESGTTENFTEYLAAAAQGAWPHEPSGEWVVPGGESAQGTAGVISAVEAGQGTIGYADASQAGDLGTAAVKVGEEFVEYSPEAAAKVLEVSEPAADRPEGDLAYELARDTAESGAYPIVLVSYHVACTRYDDPAKAELVKSFLTYVASPEGQAAAASAAGSAPISDALRAQVQSSIDLISAGS